MKLICKEACDTKKNSVKGKGLTLISSALVLFVPKCAFCWAAYMSFLSSLGFVITYQPWFLPVVTILFLVTLTKLLISSIRSKNFIAFILALAGGTLILSQRTSTGIDGLKVLAMVLIAVALLMDNFFNLYKQLIERGRK